MSQTFLEALVAHENKTLTSYFSAYNRVVHTYILHSQQSHKYTSCNVGGNDLIYHFCAWFPPLSSPVQQKLSDCTWHWIALLLHPHDMGEESRWRHL